MYRLALALDMDMLAFNRLVIALDRLLLALDRLMLGFYMHMCVALHIKGL